MDYIGRFESKLIHIIIFGDNSSLVLLLKILKKWEDQSAVFQINLLLLYCPYFLGECKLNIKNHFLLLVVSFLTANHWNDLCLSLEQ